MLARITTPAPFDLFWNYRRVEPTPLNWLRAARAAAVWRARPGWRSVSVWLRLAGWIVRFPPDICRFMLRYGKVWKEAFGRSFPGQASDMCLVAAVNGLMPRDYYRCDIAMKRGSSAFFDVVPYQLFAAPISVISAGGQGDLYEAVNDKWWLEQQLRRAGIPVAATYAMARDGAFLAPDRGEPSFGEADILLKPAASSQGKDISIWRFDRGSACWSNDGKSLDAQGLRSELLSRSAELPGGILAQEVLRNHPDMKPFAPFALSTYRTVTVTDEEGEPTVVICQLRTAVDPRSPVDNFHAGGCLYFVDISSGCFGEGEGRDYSSRPVSLRSHVVTGAPMTGIAAPGLDGVRKLAEQAHRQFRQLPVIGWDIAYTDRGPVVIEANVPPGLQPTQQVSMGGFVHTRYMELLGFHARRWIEQHEPAGSRFRVGADWRYGAGSKARKTP